MAELGVPMPRRHELLCDLAVRLWRPAAGAGLPTGAEKGRWLAESIAATGTPSTGRAPNARSRTRSSAPSAARRRTTPRPRRLVHGDVHQWNALQAGDGFALVDPDGLFAEPEYDLGIIMREDPVELVRDGRGSGPSGWPPAPAVT